MRKSKFNWGRVFLISVVFIICLKLFNHGASQKASLPVISGPDKVKPKGAIVVLAKGGNSKSYKELIFRNIGIRKYAWVAGLSDNIIFHEGNINKNHQSYIQSFTPDMPIKFINISSVFSEYYFVNKTECPSIGQGLKFSSGYRSMCYFWFISFVDYLQEYDWMLRVDSDCELKGNFDSVEAAACPFSSTLWIDLQNEKYDHVSEGKPDGDVVIGMKDLVTKVASKYHNLRTQIHTWKAPYSNVMYLSLKWLRSCEIVNEFIQEVKRSQCIYSNRWGDSPLWGAAVALAKLNEQLLPLPYYHGSHHVFVDRFGRTHQRSKRGTWSYWMQSMAFPD